MRYTHKKINVAIRGMAGGLGTSLGLSFGKNPDIEYIMGVGISDRTLNDALRRRNIHQDQLVRNAPEIVYVEGSGEKITAIRKRHTNTRIEDAQGINFDGIDVIIDAATPGSFDRWKDRYAQANATVLAQAGEGTLDAPILSPPKGEISKGRKVYKIGDCIISAIVPVIEALKEASADIKLTVVTQRTAPLLGIPTSDQTDAVYFLDKLGEQTVAKIRDITGFENLDLLSYLQTVGIRHYVVTLNIETKSSLSGHDMYEILYKKPRISVFNDMEGTHDIVYLRKEMQQIDGFDLSPIGVCLKLGREHSTRHRLHVTIDHQTIAVGANLDAIRMTAGGLDAELAMEITDGFMGYRRINSLSDQAKEYIRKYR